ncbi:hypothetical protein Q0601_03330 [Paracoccus onubensis]|uniref:hypothetical protein n=1 Tax=Paracoccus onubensis TaxID=1675788 RepID=UPI00272EEC2D|nr:hypothetical protein [Paracoccus onubensis]MDP0926196.1 hypothetical protein [Paracoccus onubensis]
MNNFIDYSKQSGQPDISLHMLMNDSGPTLVEWVLHHRRIGFHRITVYGDSANEQADALGRALENAGLISYRPSAHPGLAAANTRQRVVTETVLREGRKDAEYLLWLMPEDFVHIETGGGMLGDLFAALPQIPDVLSLTCQIAGSSGQRRHSGELLCQRFGRGTSDGLRGPLLAATMRSFFRPRVARRLQSGRPVLKPKFAKRKEPLIWLNGAGADTEGRFLEGGWLAPREAPGFGLGRVVSYVSQDAETWLLRHVGAGPDLPFITPDMLKATITQFFRWNFSFIDVILPQDSCQKLEKLRQDLFQEFPDILRAHQAVIAEFGSRLDRLLAGQDPQARQAIALFLEGKNPPASMFQWHVPFGVEVTRPFLDESNMRWTSELTAREAEPDNEEETWAGTEQDDQSEEDGADRAADTEGKNMPRQSLAPGWLGDFRLSGQAHGFYHSMPNYACVHAARSHEHLLVSFDNLSSARENPVARDPWGYDFVRKAGWSHLGVMTFIPAWYRNDGLHRYLLSLKESGFFRQFQSVTMFGTSMGGYGAAAFSSLAPGCKVAAFSPQSSLSSRIAGWDGRYLSGRMADWDGAFCDAARESASAGQVWLFYDPKVELDRRHCERFSPANSCHIPLRHADHKTALMLRNGKVLSKTMRGIVTGEATRSSLLKLYRNCRLTPDYLEVLRERALVSGGKKRLDRLERSIATVSSGPDHPL